MPSILQYSLEELRKILTDNKFESYRAKQIFGFLYHKDINNFNEMFNLPKKLINFLNENYSILPIKELKEKVSIKKDTYKYVFELEDKLKIESVIIQEKKRNTLCISSQVGCPLDCIFCATGTMGFKRSLSAAEIVGQFLYLKQKYKKIDNIVFMGMGEPFLNYRNVRKAILVLLDREGLRLSPKRITISTAGMAKGIRTLAGDDSINKVNLAVSLNSPDQNVRASLMPFSKKISLKELIPAIKYYQHKTKKRVTIEYVMFDEINMSKIEAKQIMNLYNNQFNFNLNLIPYNSLSETIYYRNKDIQTPSPSSIKYFTNFFKYTTLEIIQRKRKGRDIAAACGQLVQKNL